MMRNLQPVYMFCEEGVTDQYRALAADAIDGVFTLAGVKHLVQVLDFGHWRAQKYMAQGQLVPNASVDWYVAEGSRASTRQGQVNGSRIIDLYRQDSQRRAKPRYDVMLLAQDLQPEAPNVNFVFGLTQPGVGAVISTHRFSDAPDEFEFLVAHEFAHVLGVVAEGRPQYDRESSMPGHCVQRCIMRAANSMEEVGANMRMSLNNGIFCPNCLRDLQNNFR